MAVRSLIARSRSSRVSTQMIFVPIRRRKRRSVSRDRRRRMTRLAQVGAHRPQGREHDQQRQQGEQISVGHHLRSGELPPATQATVPMVIADAQPQVTMAAGAPSSSAIRAPTFICNSVKGTK